MSVKIGLIGGTGIEGKGLALRFAHAGAQVVVGSRSEQRAREAAAGYNEILGKDLVRGALNEHMIGESEIVLFTVPAVQAIPAIDSCKAALNSRHVLVDVTVPIQIVGGRLQFDDRLGASSSEVIAARLGDRVPLVGAFKTIPAHLLEDLEHPLDCDLFVCGDSAEAKERVIAAGKLLPGLRPLDAGPLQAARTLERMTILAIHLNKRYKSKHARYQIQGLS